MRRDIVTSVIAIIVFTVLLGLVYPLVITGVSQVAFPGNANGQKVYVNGKLVGSKIIGQASSSRCSTRTASRRKKKKKSSPNRTRATSRAVPRRPKAAPTTRPRARSPTAAPTTRSTEEADAENIKAYLELEKPYDPGLTTAQIPVDAVNTSGSNLDPEISPANARIQAHRVAAKRRLSLGVVDGLISKYTDSRGLGFSGEPGVNVLELNLALDRLTGGAR